MSSMNSMRLRELIRAVRQCKTASEERALINKESANIREGFQENTPYLRTRNMLKLLYLSMLGYPTEFGQLEVVNLLSQSDFSGKRIGYLALQLILDEKDEVLTLAENHMKSDMGSGNLLVEAVALNAAANIASEDMARDIFDEVMKLVESPNPYLKKKACLAALRIVKKVPEHAEYFLEKFTNVFHERHSGALLCSLTLINACLQTEEGGRFMTSYRQLTAAAVRILKTLLLSSKTTEQDVGGVTDPFLQVKLLEFMRIIGKDSVVTSEALNDVLAQVITNTDASRNVGCAVHYECVRTIDDIESDDSLRTLGVNTISRFIASTRDNNLRFVALQTLYRYAQRNLAIVQRHQSIILECLKDVDISIRRQALELTVVLITEHNIRLLVPDLLTYLSLCSEEMREDVTLHICRIIEEKSPSEEWRVDLSLKLLRLAKQHAPINFATRFIAVLSNQSDDIQTNAVNYLWVEASFPFDALHQSRKAFLVVALWAIGEYAENLVRHKGIEPAAVAACLCDITANTTFTLIKQYGLTALMKLATKFPETRTVVLSTFSSITTSLDCELQQRACEYTTLLTKFADAAAFSFSRMPPIRHAEEEAVMPVQVVSVKPETLQKQSANVLDSLFNVEEPKRGSETQETSAPQASGAAAAANDINALFGGSDASMLSRPSPSASSGGQMASAIRAAMQGREVFECQDFKAFVAASMEGTVIRAEVSLVSRASKSMDNLSFQVAVPRACVVDVAPLPSAEIPSGGVLTQALTVNTEHYTKNPRQLMLRVKLLYSIAGEPQERMFQVTEDV